MSDQSPSAYPYPDTPLEPHWGSRKAQVQAGFAVAAALAAMLVAPHAASPHAIALLIVLASSLSIILAFAPSPQRLTSAVSKDLFVLGAALAATALEFARAGRGTPIPFDPPKVVVTTGPYAILARFEAARR